MERTLDTIPVSQWGFFDETIPPLVIAGPCSAESELQVMMTAKGLHEFGIHVYRAGIWKPRTHPGSFEGVGSKGLKWLQKVKNEYGMKVCTEVANEKHVYECLKYGIDMVWIGARTTANPFLVQEIADALHDTDIPVLVKNPVSPDLDLWIGALERLNAAGIRKLGVIHRGFTPLQKIPYRNEPGWGIAVELRTRFPEIPFFADPSHMGGSRKYLQELSQRAMDLGLDGLMIESHCDPSCALSDAKQQLIPDMSTALTRMTRDSRRLLSVLKSTPLISTLTRTSRALKTPMLMRQTSRQPSNCVRSQMIRQQRSALLPRLLAMRKLIPQFLRPARIL